MGCFLFVCEFWWRLLHDLCVFWAKIGFCNAKFSEFGARGVGWPFFDEAPKRHILGWFHAFWAIMHANPNGFARIIARIIGFSSRRAHEKKGHYTKSQRRYILPISGEFPTEPTLTKIGIWVGVADIINHTKFGNDGSGSTKLRRVEFCRAQ